MQISFNGVVAPYTYNCPHAHRLRNIEHCYLERKEEPEEVEGVSKRVFGIEQHELIGQYIKGEIDQFEYITDTVESFRARVNVQVEVQKFYDVDFSPLDRKPLAGDYVSARTDAIAIDKYLIDQADWKFGNPEWGAAKYYDETDFFMALAISEYPDVGEYRSVIHFPQHDYSLPIHTYTIAQAAKLQHKYQQRVDRILNDKFFKPAPGRIHCRFCDQRSEDAGGTGKCSYTVI
jgi:hypothetical protein